MSLQRARTVEEYVEWVRQAVFEVDDLKNCLLYEAEDMTSFPGYLEPLEESIKQLYQTMVDGKYAFGREDLGFMDLLHSHGDEIPFHTLLKQINETHRKGLDVGEDD